MEAVKRQQKAALSGVNEVSHRRENTEAAIQRATAALEMIMALYGLVHHICLW